MPTHTAPDRTTVISSVTYERAPGGEPTKITREDGSSVDLLYDASLRLERETYYDDQGVLIEEITYTYDADGNRQSVSSGVAEGTYDYGDSIHQLSTIVTDSGTETYRYDDGGRVDQIIRDGETFNLIYNSDDLLMNVTDANGVSIVSYDYDSEGRRVEMSDERGTRDYLVAPNPGDGLASPHLISDAAGDPLAAYVYAGSMPLMRLDELGNPVYYLEDGMGSVIGLADGAGAAVETFKYDAFGNLREGGATDGDALGGDFRFQGHWLESNTDFYHFRARYYDPEAGRFMSRDPIDVIESQPESSNPYQFVYNNPLIYNDPTGEMTFSIGEQALVKKMQSILRKYQSKVKSRQLKQVVDDVQGSVAEVTANYMESLLPTEAAGIFNLAKEVGIAQGGPLSKKLGDAVEAFILNNTLKPIFDQLGWSQNVYREVDLLETTGDPKSNGYRWDRNNPKERSADSDSAGKTKDVDFVVSNHLPKELSTIGFNRAWLSGDVKANAKKAVSEVINNEGQWSAMSKFAKRYQYVPMVIYPTFLTTDKKKIAKAKGEAQGQGIILQIIPLTPIRLDQIG